jgi:hypothetical protein
MKSQHYHRFQSSKTHPQILHLIWIQFEQI